MYNNVYKYTYLFGVIMTKVFIDGSAGTTGLRIFGRLNERRDIELITLPDEIRKDKNARAQALNDCDVAFLCLPDDAAREAVGLTTVSDTVIIDTSTAHRTADGWVYGFPELKGYREKIATSKRIANPGCHAGGFISLVEPLVKLGILNNEAKLTAYSLTGYSGGGKKMISQYEDENRDALLGTPRMYGLTQQHKHLPEMKKVCGLENDPVFCPVVGSFYSGMEVTVPLFASDINGTAEDIRRAYADYYTSNIVQFIPKADESGFASAGLLSGRDDMQIAVFGNDERILLVSRFDNLGKGASGAAIQNMNIVLGIDEKTGLNIAK